MIIESGHDVRLVLASAVRRDDIEGICIIAMDKDLRLLSVAEVVPRTADADVLDHVGDIAEALDTATSRPPRYFALAWTSRDPGGPDTRWLEEIDSRLASEPALAHLQLLGLIVLDPQGTSTTVPPCDFSLYPELAELPRAIAIAGPHDAGCSCQACSGDHRILDGWATAEAYDYPAEPEYDSDWKRWSPDPARAYKRWTEAEDTALVSAHFEGLSSFDISMMLQRQPGAVASRLNRLGISSRTFVAGESAPTVPLELDGPDARP